MLVVANAKGVVACVGLLYVLQGPERALAEIHRILESGECAVITTWLWLFIDAALPGEDGAAVLMTGARNLVFPRSVLFILKGVNDGS